MTNPSPTSEMTQVPTSVAPERVRLSAPVRRLFGFIVPVNLAVYLTVGAVPGVLLPVQVQGIDPAHKAGNLAIVVGIGAIAAMVMSPIAGLISDRTRSRFGRRTPWLLAGALACGLALIGMGFADGILQLVIAWSIVQLALNLVISPLTALMPDRVPSAARGLFGTLLGVGLLFGTLGGQILGAALAHDIQAAYLILPGILIVAIALFVVFCPDASSKDLRREPFSWPVFLRTFWVSPRRHPDFGWGFLGRLLLFTGYFSVTGYQLYILQDFIGLKSHAVAEVPLLSVIGLAGMVIAVTVSGPLSDRLQRRKVFVIIASLLMGVGMVIPLVAPTLTGMIAFTFLAGLGFGCYVAVDGALMSELLPSDTSFAKDLGVLNIATTLPQTVGPFLSGALVVLFGYAVLFPVGLGLAVLGAAAILPIKSVR